VEGEGSRALAGVEGRGDGAGGGLLHFQVGEGLERRRGRVGRGYVAE
jgi:hypothetical protein